MMGLRYIDYGHSYAPNQNKGYQAMTTSELWTICYVQQGRVIGVSHYCHSREYTVGLANDCNRFHAVGEPGLITTWVAMPYSEAWEWRACEVWRQEAIDARTSLRSSNIASLGSYRDQMRDAGRGHLLG